MIDAIQRVPVKHRFTGLYILLGLCALAALAAAAYLGTSNVIVQTHTHVIQQTWGKPDSSYAAAQISPQLQQAGFTVCDLYVAKRSLVCH